MVNRLSAAGVRNPSVAFRFEPPFDRINCNQFNLWVEAGAVNQVAPPVLRLETGAWPRQRRDKYI